MRDFFGKKLGRSILKTAGTLNPLDIARGEGAVKAARGGMSPGGAIGQSLFDDITRTYRETAKTWDAMKQAGNQPSMGQMASSYFKGYNLRHLAGELGTPGYVNRLNDPRMQAAISRRGAIRTGVFGAIGVSAAGSMAFGQNFMSDTLNVGLTGGGHLTAAAMMHRYGGTYGPMAAAGYAGWAGLNALRQGDNFGPF